MADREKNMEILRKEIEELEVELEKKKLLRKPVMSPGTAGCTETLGTYEQRQEIKELERKIEQKKNLLLTYEENLFGKHESVPIFNKEDYLRPEYRQGGYFTSQDYYDKCEEFHRILEEHGEDILSMPRSEYIFLKKQFFQNTYGITWLAEEEQFLPGCNIIVHAEKL